ncbi:hypothetical protein BC940DRAFT_308995 [Gongronella butleri]|nr:hypothetical protein BC940DRAFT_308995 [Gongronella butleri]
MNVYYSMWTVLDTNTWAYSSPTVNGGMPAPRIDHTATMLSNQHIMILGGLVFTKNVTDPIGRQTLLPVSMNQLLLYDMANAQWKTITAGGNIPAPRRGHSAVLHRGKASIIVFGGGTPDDDEDMLNDVFVLRLSDYEWNSPSIYGVPPKPRKYHQANLMDQLMLVSFGSAPGNDGYNDVNILDTAEWQWISTYTPNPKWLSGNFSSSGVISNSSGEANGGSAAANTPNSNGGSSETRIKAGVIAGIISGAVVVLGGGIFLLLSKVLYQQRQVKDKISILPKSASSESVPFPTKPLAQPLAGVHPRPSSVITLTDLGERQVAKPDNRSSYGYATDDGLQHKPNEHDTIPPT